MQFSSRRSFLSSASAIGVGGLASVRSAFGSSSTANAGTLGTADRNVLQYGARADQSFDNTQAFQAAMDDAAKSGGGTVYAPPGGYLFRGNLKVPRGVTLRGSFGCVPSHSGIVKNAHAVRPGQDGTALFVTGGKGQEDGVPFLTAGTNSTVAGLTIYYPEQVTDATPVPYPWAIAMRGDNAAVLDVELLNPYQGIDTKTSARHNIRNVTGQPIRRGIFVDAIYDIGRIENVHFNPWWTSSGQLYQWQLVHGEAFVFGRADWEYVLNTFAFGYGVGYSFVKTEADVCNGNFLGIGADCCNRAVRVEQSARYGILITNGEFTSFLGEGPTQVEVLPGHSGSVRFVNSAFWGPCAQIAKVDGDKNGTVSFSDCIFCEWDKNGKKAALQFSGGKAVVRGCEFQQSKPQIELGERVRSAVISHNLFEGRQQVMNAAGKRAQIELNGATE
jgi:hypothetical protein